MTNEKTSCIYPHAGYVYLFHAIGTPKYKIGRSVKFLNRLRTIEGQSPIPLEIISHFWTPNTIADENSLHEHFEEYRVWYPKNKHRARKRTEWFELYESLNSCKFCFSRYRPEACKYALESIKNISKVTQIHDIEKLRNTHNYLEEIFHVPSDIYRFERVKTFTFDELPKILDRDYFRGNTKAIDLVVYGAISKLAYDVFNKEVKISRSSK